MTNPHKESIPTQEVKLSTGEKLVMYDYLTIGESRSLQRIFLKGGNFDVNKQEFQAMGGEVFLEVQDTALGFLAKEVVKKDGEKEVFTMDWFNSQTIEDGNKIIDVVNSLTNEAQEGQAEEKKA